MIRTWTPYFALTLAWTSSNSGPEVVKVAVPSTDCSPDFTRPRESLGVSVIRGLLRNRLTLPVDDEVQKPNRRPSSATIQVGVETGTPLLR